MSATYAIYTSPSHKPVPDHLPTLIVCPHGKPNHILYTYLHTNYNKENYLLTPSESGDLCVAKLFPPNPSAALAGGSSTSSHSSSSQLDRHAVRCEASRNLRWTIRNEGIQHPVYKLTLPNPDNNQSEQPLFQVSKPNPHSPWWTLFYFTYAGHLIPPKRVEFGKILKNQPSTEGGKQSGGGTKISVTGRTEEEKAVWKTLGEGNEDMVEWIIVCAALNVLDDEIMKAAEAAGVHSYSRPPPPTSVPAAASRGPPPSSAQAPFAPRGPPPPGGPGPQRGPPGPQMNGPGPSRGPPPPQQQQGSRGPSPMNGPPMNGPPMNGPPPNGMPRPGPQGPPPGHPQQRGPPPPRGGPSPSGPPPPQQQQANGHRGPPPPPSSQGPPQQFHPPPHQQQLRQPMPPPASPRSQPAPSGPASSSSYQRTPLDRGSSDAMQHAMGDLRLSNSSTNTGETGSSELAYARGPSPTSSRHSADHHGRPESPQRTLRQMASSPQMRQMPPQSQQRPPPPPGPPGPGGIRMLPPAPNGAGPGPGPGPAAQGKAPSTYLPTSRPRPQMQPPLNGSSTPPLAVPSNGRFTPTSIPLPTTPQGPPASPRRAPVATPYQPAHHQRLKKQGPA